MAALGKWLSSKMLSKCVKGPGFNPQYNKINKNGLEFVRMPLQEECQSTVCLRGGISIREFGPLHISFSLGTKTSRLD